MKLIRWATVVLVMPLMGMAIVSSPSRAASSPAQDAAVTYKTKCSACHGAKAEKSFDPAKSDADLLNAVLNGVKPRMPGFEKSLGADACKALLTQMRDLRK